MAQNTDKSGFSDFGRFSEPALLVMISLANGPKHGYAMIEDIQLVAGMKMGPGTLYGAISRLEARGLIEALEPENRRNPYRLTGAGEKLLRQRLQSLAAVARVGEERLAGA